MRGAVDPQVDGHGSFERLLSKDLSRWLCNFYFEIVKLPRYTDGQREYEVELQWTSGLLGYPQREDSEEEDEAQDFEDVVTKQLNSKPDQHLAARPGTGIQAQLRKRAQTARTREAGDDFSSEESDLEDVTYKRSSRVDVAPGLS